MEAVFGQPGVTAFMTTALSDPLGETAARVSSICLRLAQGASVLVPIAPRNVYKHRSGELKVVNHDCSIYLIPLFHEERYCVT